MAGSVNAARLPFCVGLTGGVGAGKSVAAEMFSRLGAAIIDTDLIARELTGPDGEALPGIASAFGQECLDASGGLDRAWMRNKVFSSPEDRRRLESILHPMIRDTSVQRLQASHAAYAMLVVPLLAENPEPYARLIRRILVVEATPERQLQRTAARPGVGAEMARSIMAAQIAPEARRALADDVLDNNGDLATLSEGVRHLHNLYLQLASA